MALGSFPALLSASTTLVIAAVFLASASFTVGAWLSTPALTVTLSGADLTVPLPAMVVGRLGGALALARAAAGGGGGGGRGSVGGGGVVPGGGGGGGGKKKGGGKKGFGRVEVEGG